MLSLEARSNGYIGKQSTLAKYRCLAQSTLRTTADFRLLLGFGMTKSSDLFLYGKLSGRMIKYKCVLKHAEGVRLKIVIFNLGICDAARPKVPADLDAACAAEWEEV